MHCYPQTYVHSAEHSFRIPYRFIYNDQMQLIGLEEPLTNYLANRFFYNENGTLKYSEDLDAEKRAVRTVLYSYDAKGRLNRADLFWGSPSEKSPYNYQLFSYDADDRLIKIEYYSKETSGEYIWFQTHTYTYLSNRQMKTSSNYQMLGSNLSELETLRTFDNQKSPYWSIPGYRTMLMVYKPHFSFKNNIISYRVLTKDSSNQYDYTSTFEYSPDGFPIAEQRTVGGYTVYRHDYTYTCK